MINDTVGFTMKRQTIAKCYSYKVHITYLPLPQVMGYNSAKDCTQWKASNIFYIIVITNFYTGGKLQQLNAAINICPVEMKYTDMKRVKNNK